MAGGRTKESSMEANEIKTTKDLAAYRTEKMKGCSRGNNATFNWDISNCLEKIDSNYHAIIGRNTVEVFYAGFPVCSLTLKCKREAKKAYAWSSYEYYTFFVDSFALAKGEEDAVIADVIERAKAHQQKREQAEKDTAASFLEQLAEHGFKDMEALAHWIQYNASKEQKSFIRSWVY